MRADSRNRRAPWIMGHAVTEDFVIAVTSRGGKGTTVIATRGATRGTNGQFPLVTHLAPPDGGTFNESDRKFDGS